MLLKISHPTQECIGNLNITGSKSETNRLLLLQALYPNIIISNQSNSDDSVAMAYALKTDSGIIDIHHAGTAMRFLTAYFAVQENREVVLTGSKRMKERPISVLVDALRALGANIEYENNEGFPPLRIRGKKLEGGKVTLPANISSQYISALLLIAPRLEKGLKLTLEGEITSLPYLEMTLSLLNRIGISFEFSNKEIYIPPHDNVDEQTQIVESDWSSASYHFSCVSLSNKGQVRLNSYFKNSLQGDSALVEIYEKLGVQTHFKDNQMILEKIKNFQLPKTLNLNLIKTPDIAQTIAVTCYGLGIACNLEGLHTLKIKETDRLVALENELTKIGATLKVSSNSLHLSANQNFKKDRVIATYSDHRMAMAFAPIGIKNSCQISEAEVVTKSYPEFWEDLKRIGFEVIIK